MKRKLLVVQEQVLIPQPHIGFLMDKTKPTLESLIKGGKYCVKCGSNIKKDAIGHSCEIIECPKPIEKKEKNKFDYFILCSIR